MERRAYLITVGTGVTVGLSGCVEEPDSDSSDPQGESSSSSEESDTGSTSNNEVEETCEIEEETRQELLVDREYELTSEGDSMEETFEIQEGDRITFDVQPVIRIGGEEQEVDLIIESPIGGTEFDGRITDFSNEVGFTTAGDANLTLTNAGTVTEEERNQFWSDSGSVSAGNFYSGWITLREGDRVDYLVRQLGDDARPKLVVENENRDIIKEEEVAEVIDGEFTAPEDGEYYFKWENTATLTSGRWRWEFERVIEEVVPANGSLTIEREFTEENEVCD